MVRRDVGSNGVITMHTSLAKHGLTAPLFDDEAA